MVNGEGELYRMWEMLSRLDLDGVRLRTDSGVVDYIVRYGGQHITNPPINEEEWLKLNNLVQKLPYEIKL